MQSRRARALAIGLAIASSGCAELAPRVPALTIEAIARERREVATADARWSWGIGARLASTLGAGAPALEAEDSEPERAPRAAPSPARRRLPCRLADLCIWEARARTRALARLDRLAAEGAR